MSLHLPSTNREASSPLGCNHDEVPRLKKVLKRMLDQYRFQLVQTVRWVAQGHAISKVAELTGVSVPTVYTWLKRYRQRHHTAP